MDFLNRWKKRSKRVGSRQQGKTKNYPDESMLPSLAALNIPANSRPKLRRTGEKEKDVKSFELKGLPFIHSPVAARQSSSESLENNAFFEPTAIPSPELTPECQTSTSDEPLPESDIKFSMIERPYYMVKIPQMIRSAFEQAEDGTLTVTHPQFRKLVRDYCKFPAYFGIPLFYQIKRFRSLSTMLVNSGTLPPESLLELDDSQEEDAGQIVQAKHWKKTDNQNKITLRDFMRFWTPEVQRADRTARILYLIITAASTEQILSIELEGRRKETPGKIHIREFGVFVEALIDRHPDLSSFRRDVNIRIRYVTYVLSNLMLSLGTNKVTPFQLRKTNILKAFCQCACRNLDSITCFNIENFVNFNNIYNSLTLGDRRSHIQSMVLDKQQNESEAELSAILANLPGYRISTQLRNRMVEFFSERNILTIEYGESIEFEKYLLCVKALTDEMGECSLPYWFRILDVDQDGYLGEEDIRFWYEEITRICGGRNSVLSWEKISILLIDALQVKPCQVDGNWKISCLDIRRSGLAHVLYETIVESILMSKVSKKLKAID